MAGSHSVWKEIPGHVNYEASKSGEIRRIGRNKPLKAWLQNCGYLVVSLSNNGCVTNHTVHSLIALTFLGPRPNKMDVNHKDHNKTNNSFDNLEYMSRSANLRHAFPLGGCSRSKLDGRKVREIRTKIALKIPYPIIAKGYDVRRETIECIAMGKTWSWLQTEEI